jgi:DNA-binding NarL/FixJ family response regulator
MTHDGNARPPLRGMNATTRRGAGRDRRRRSARMERLIHRHGKEASAPMVVRVAVADPLPLFRHGVRAALAEAGFPAEAPEDLLAWVRVDEPRLVLFSVTGSDDWVLLPELCRARAETKVIAVLPETSVQTCVRALSAGAVGILARNASPPLMKEVFAAAVGGRSIVPTAVLRALADSAPQRAETGEDHLPSTAEQDWLRQLARGGSVAHLAAAVGYSERMMFRLLRELYTKIGAGNRTEALIKARDAGWL